MNGVNSYAAYDNYYSSTINNKSNDTKAASGRKTNSSQNSVSQPKLSDKAQDLLEKLKKTYKNMDFMVAGKGDDAKDYVLKDRKGFDAFIEKAPVVVPVGKLNLKDAPRKNVEVDSLVLKATGMTKEDIEKYADKEDGEE